MIDGRTSPSPTARRRALIKKCAAVAAGCALAVTGTPPAGAETFAPGAPGIGDPYFPSDGNGGYDVKTYKLDLSYAPDTDELSGIAVIVARATQGLSAFNLDFHEMTVRSATVDSASATWSRSGDELTITPPAGIPNGHWFTTVIRYDGVPQPFGAPDEPNGWIATDDGAVVAGQPPGGSSWFPANDPPSEKAAFTFRMGVPDGPEVIAKGELPSVKTRRGRTTCIWDAGEPMATYLAT